MTPHGITGLERIKYTEGRLGNILPPKDISFLRNPRVIEIDGKFEVLTVVLTKT
jgi:hypothetical protein